MNSAASGGISEVNNISEFIDDKFPCAMSRNCFSCGQSKQATSLYHTNFQMRMDKTAVLLNSGQVPLVKSEYLQYINQEEMPYGENAIVAIMCYTGYNVEDAILVNEASLKRGLFRTTYYSTYETHEEKEVKNSVHLNAYNKVFGIEGEESIMSANLRQSKDWFSKKSNSRVRSSIAGKFF